MRTRSLIASAVFAGIAIACSQPTTGDDGMAQRGAWGSSDAGLVMTDSSATFHFLAGNCYGSYADIAQAIPTGAFTLTGTFTQLMGVYPGKMEYPAEFSGSVVADRMTVTVTVPTLQRTIGPYSLVHGVNNAWPQCLYP